MKVPHQELCEEAEKHERRKGTKCAFCGQYYLQDTDFYCPGCGKGRAQGERTSGDELQEKLRYVSSKHERESLVRNWPIPFCPKDIVSIAILARSRYETDEELSDPFWVKYSECAEKAKLAIATATQKTDKEELSPLYHIVKQYECDYKKKKSEDNIITFLDVIFSSIAWGWNLAVSILGFFWNVIVSVLKFLWKIITIIFEWIDDWFIMSPKKAWCVLISAIYLTGFCLYEHYSEKEEEEEKQRQEAVVPIAKAQYDSLMVLLDSLPEPTSKNAKESARKLLKISWTDIPNDESYYCRDFLNHKRHYADRIKNVWDTKNGLMPLEIEDTYNINR